LTFFVNKLEALPTTQIEISDPENRDTEELVIFSNISKFTILFLVQR
jgi:hypothetical protein